MLIIELSLLLLLLISLLSIVALLISRTAGRESAPSISSPTRSRKMLPSREVAPTNCVNHVGATSILGSSASAAAAASFPRTTPASRENSPLFHCSCLPFDFDLLLNFSLQKQEQCRQHYQSFQHFRLMRFHQE